MDFREYLDRELLGNSWERWGFALGVFFLVLLGSWLVKWFAENRLRKFAGLTQAHWDDLALHLLEQTKSFFLPLVALRTAAQTLEINARADQIVDIVFFLALFVQLGLWLAQAIDFLGNAYVNRTITRDAGRATTARAILFFGKVMVWGLVLLLLLDNWGVKVGPFIAGLGIGGIAIALAVQNILGDLLASLSIIFDKPFVIGDAIQVDSDIGTVEKVGLKTTRIKSLSGEQLVFSNSELLKSRIRNYKRMAERRVVTTIGIIYETDPEKLDSVRATIREAVEAAKELRFDRVHLAKLSASSLDYELVYWVNSPDYNVYIELQHRFHVELMRRFKAAGFEFAYPTQKLFVDDGKSDERR